MQVQLSSLDGRRFTAEDAQKPIWFGEVVVGARQLRVVRVSNPTLLPLPFCWQQTDDPVSSGKPHTLLHPISIPISQGDNDALFMPSYAWHLAMHECLPDQASLAPPYSQSLLT